MTMTKSTKVQTSVDACTKLYLVVNAITDGQFPNQGSSITMTTTGPTMISVFANHGIPSTQGVPSYHGPAATTQVKSGNAVKAQRVSSNHGPVTVGVLSNHGPTTVPQPVSTLYFSKILMLLSFTTYSFV